MSNSKAELLKEKQEFQYNRAFWFKFENMHGDRGI